MKIGEQEAHDHAVLMAYEAFRICIGAPTRITPPNEVLLWLKLMTKDKANEPNPPT